MLALVPSIEGSPWIVGGTLSRSGGCSCVGAAAANGSAAARSSPPPERPANPFSGPFAYSRRMSWKISPVRDLPIGARSAADGSAVAGVPA